MKILLQPIKFCLMSILCLLVISIHVSGQSDKQPPKPAAKPAPAKQSDKSIIDSLQALIENQYVRIDLLDSLLETEKQTTDDLRNQVIRIDEYRKKLESNINSFKGENLKLNQSNRILIVFNALVALLLIFSLVFFVRRIGRKQTGNLANGNNIPDKGSEKLKFTSVDDKLHQLERLGKLREKALLSEEEFLAEKQRILGKH